MKKTKKISKAARERVYMVRTALVLVSIAMLFAIGGGILSIKNQMSTRTYTSDFMKIQFDYPAELDVNSDSTSLTLNKSNEDGNILISSYGTNYPDTKTHVNASLSRKRVNPTLRHEVNGKNVSGEMVEFALNGLRYRIYYFVKNYALYQFEANDPSLFSDLDAIAKSFRILE